MRNQKLNPAFKKSRLAITIAAVAAISSFNAFAEEAATGALAEDVSEKVAVEDSSYGIEEVIVTAQKRTQSIQDVPLSITAFSGDFLKEKGVATFDDVARMTPNFSIATSSQPTNSRISIRGIGASGNSAIESSVGVFVDGVYYPRPGSVIGKLLDVNSFEVLRGPQGTLFGRNTVAGAVNMTTNNPSQETEGMVEVSQGDYGAVETTGVFNTAISDSVAARVAFTYADRDGYGYNSYDGQEVGERDDLVVRSKVLFDLSDKTSLLVTADYSEINSGGNIVEVLNSTSTAAYEGRNEAFYGASPVTADSYDGTINQAHNDEFKDEQKGLSFDFNYELGNGLALRSITAVRDWDANSSGNDVKVAADLIPADSNYTTETLSQELQLMSPGGETVDWLAGLFYYQESYDIGQPRSGGDAFCPTMANLKFPEAVCLANPLAPISEISFGQELESIAAFGQATWNINDTWNTTLGIRLTQDEKNGDYVMATNNPAVSPFTGAETTEGMKISESATTGFANVNWHTSEDTMLFATLSTGYKSGGFNSASGGKEALGVERRVFDAEETTNYELGLKSTLLDGYMTANVSLYRTDMADFQDRAFDGISFIVVNAGELRQQGMEADINWAPIEPLRIVTGISYLDSEYLSFVGAPGLPGGDVQDLTGERRNYSPEWQANISADWTQSFANGMQWFVGGSYSWIDEQNIGASSNNNSQSLQASYELANARMGVRSWDWDVTLFANNLTDEGYCQTIFNQGFGGPLGAVDAADNTSVQRCALGAPRTVNLKAAYHF